MEGTQPMRTKPSTFRGTERHRQRTEETEEQQRKRSNMPAKTSRKKKGGAKSEKRKAEKDSRKQLQSALKHANAQADPLSLLPVALLALSLSPEPSPAVKEKASDLSNDDKVPDGAPRVSIEHRASPLPENLLGQCLKLFEENMGELYKRSNWGLDVEGKRLEMEHKSARFLLILKKRNGTAGEVTEEGDDDAKSRGAKDARQRRADDTDDAGAEVVGFAHYRFEVDDEDKPAHPVGYLYELQISSLHQKHGLGRKLTALVERISSELRMEKVMLTVFKANGGAMKFYERQGYAVDESSPSNFEGGETCDYEILSKSMAK